MTMPEDEIEAHINILVRDLFNWDDAGVDAYDVLRATWSWAGGE